MADQSITVCGTLGRDPELQYTAGGTALAKFSIASAQRWRDKAGDWQEKTTWFNIQAWGPLAENVAASLVKGLRVVVSGRVETYQWEAEDGSNRYGWQVTAEDIAPSLKWAQAKVEATERTRAG